MLGVFGVGGPLASLLLSRPTLIHGDQRRVEPLQDTTSGNTGTVRPEVGRPLLAAQRLLEGTEDTRPSAE